MNVDPYKIEKKITAKTKGIVAVSTMGKPPSIPELKYIAKKHNLALIIDNAEGHGCKYLGKFMEDYADITTYSCYQAHLIQSVEYGFCCTNNDRIADIIRCTRTHGREGGKNSFNHIYLGYNSKPSDLHSIIGLSQIDKFWDRFNVRVSNVKRIRDGLRGYEKYMMFSEEDENYTNSPHAFSIALTDSSYDIEKFKQHLTNYKIQWKLNFLSLPTQQQAIQKLFPYSLINKPRYPMAEWVGDLGIHFGCHEHLTKEDCDYIVCVITDYFDKERWKKQ